MSGQKRHRVGAVAGLGLLLPVVAALGAAPTSNPGLEARRDGGHGTLAPDAGSGLPPCSGGIAYVTEVDDRP